MASSLEIFTSALPILKKRDWSVNPSMTPLAKSMLSPIENSRPFFFCFQSIFMEPPLSVIRIFKSPTVAFIVFNSVTLYKTLSASSTIESSEYS